MIVGGKSWPLRDNQKVIVPKVLDSEEVGDAPFYSEE